MIACAMLVKDAAATVADAIRSVRPRVDEIAVLLDDSTADDTAAVLDRLAAEPGCPIRVETHTWPGSFGEARSRSFQLASDEHPWLMVLDSDDVVVGAENIPAIVARAEASGAKAVAAAYEQAEPDGGRSFLWLNRIVRRGSGHWEGRLHELWRGPTVADLVIAHPAAFRVRHERHDNDPARYRALIEQAAADPQTTPRAPLMLAEQLLAVDDARAAELLEEYLQGRHDRVEGDPNTYRLQALLWLVQANRRLGRNEQAARWARQGPAYEQALRRAVRAGEIADPGFYRDLDASTEALASGDTGDLLLPPPVVIRRDVGRNDPCPCGSGVKFKKCHGV